MSACAREDFEIVAVEQQARPRRSLADVGENGIDARLHRFGTHIRLLSLQRNRTSRPDADGKSPPDFVTKIFSFEWGISVRAMR
jgi:hypothetical protein